ncbi:hypothetical protein PUN28_007042 [Cardiocondyla obscurior]|uniref:Secreted protein n=1 Tax=Cardiocondyla obscurior TaxID=286306 RepID=A0AAW2G3E7_9HYME
MGFAVVYFPFSSVTLPPLSLSLSLSFVRSLALFINVFYCRTSSSFAFHQRDRWILLSIIRTWSKNFRGFCFLSMGIKINIKIITLRKGFFLSISALRHENIIKSVSNLFPVFTRILFHHARVA